MAPYRCCLQASLFPIGFPKKHGWASEGGCGRMQGPLMALGGDLGGDAVRMRQGEVLLSPPGAGKSHCPGRGQGGSWAG